jgi:bacterioferritin-associated ferredoxin
MYICICNGITDGEIRRAVTAGARTLADLTAELGVASCCGRCADSASSLVEESREAAVAAAAAVTDPDRRAACRAIGR